MARTPDGSRTRTYTHGSRCRGQSRTLNKRHGSRNRENKSFMKSLRGSLRGILEVEIMEEEAASEAEAEDEDSEAGASRCPAEKPIFALRHCKLAWRWWYGIPTMECICMHFFLFEDCSFKFQHASLGTEVIADAHLTSK